MNHIVMFTRKTLAERWGTSERTVDRRRKLGLIPWIDIAGGHGKRPIVRFRVEDIEALESQMVKGPVMEARREATK